ncbi:GNAT family N-acetyltransferase [Streptomyces sp. P38-E01]|uniref:GNAT family N-acetyltransferase n=1 Tax=Streptomyces tardus TaxID=2780544 RepID=A0A949JE17_9ACTN|nr:GNAT family N-acetyltransferase [Streptomyces tardus]MBU7598358.1 GNAT family N-acetyltransferase [Streptomyces tardus]
MAGELRAAARGSGVLVRSAVPADAGGIAVVQVDGWRAAYAHILPPAELAELSLVRAEQLWHGVIGGARESGKQVLVAEGDGGEVLGFAALGPDEAELGQLGGRQDVGVRGPPTVHLDHRDTARVGRNSRPNQYAGAPRGGPQLSLPAGELYAFYVHPRHWRHGLGGALMDAALRRWTQNGVRAAVLWVYERNASARAFYEHHGWHFDPHTPPTGPPPDERELCYRRRLPLPVRGPDLPGRAS